MKLERKEQQGSACRRRARQEGAVLVEFALVLPLLLLLLFGMVEFGRAFNYWIDETHLANAAARWAAVGNTPTGAESLEAWIREEANTNELGDGAVIRICLPSGSKKVGEPVRAEVSYPFEWMPFIGETLGGITETTLTGSATMRIEREPSYVGETC